MTDPMELSQQLAAAIAKMPQRAELRIGVVTVSTTTRLEVDVQGGIVRNPAVVNGLQPPVGATVSLLRQDSTWLVLGSSVAPGDGGMLGLVAKAVNSAGTNVLTGATTFIPYDLVLFDTAKGWNLAVSADSYTVQYPGVYLANAGCGLAANATGQRTDQVRRNGVAFEGSTAIFQTTAAGTIDTLSQVVLAEFNRGDTIAQTVVQNSGATVATLTGDANRPFLQLFRVGDLQ
jgi:hypothetical protein